MRLPFSWRANGEAGIEQHREERESSSGVSVETLEVRGLVGPSW